MSEFHQTELNQDTPTRPNQIDELYMPAMPPLGLISFARRIYFAWLIKRRLNNLMRLSDKQLHDIGHRRVDLQRAFAKSLTCGPDRLLREAHSSYAGENRRRVFTY